jgi:sugar phosphate isomerase/epimerase
MTMIMTCFADEISADLDEQLQVLKQEGLRYLELRNVWDTNVLKLSEEQMERVRSKLQDNGFRISSIGSPLGKYNIGDDFAPQLHDLRRAIAVAKFFETPYIRIFSFHLPNGEPAENHRDEVLSRMRQFTELAEQSGITLLLENESNMYGDKDDRYLDILQSCDSPHLRSAFDPGNFVMNGVRPVSEAYPKVAGYIEYVHVKDATTEPRQFVPAGKGEGEFPQFLMALKQKEYSGFLSVEPHLKHYMPEASDPERVIAAIRALKQLLADEGMAWE